MTSKGHTLGTNWAQNFGSLRLLKSGRYQARYTAPDGKRYSSTFPDKLSALAWLAENKKAIDLGAWESPNTEKETVPTVGELTHHWLQLVAPGIRNSTLRAYKEVVGLRVLGHERLASTPVDKLTPRKVAGWWQDTVEAFPDTAYRNHRAYQKLRTIMNLAVEYGYLTSNPVHVRVASRRPKSKRKELPSTEQLRAILEHVPHRYRLITVLCLFHGLRLGEALALHGKHVFPDKVIIEGTLARVPNGNGGVKMELHPPKTQAGYRTVPVMPEFQHIVTEHLATYQPRSEGYATETDNGAAVFDTSYRSIFYRAKDKAGIEDDLTPHYGRVYLITRLAEAGATPREIGAILGQEDVSTIVNTYMRARQSRPKTLMSSLDLSD